MFIHTHDTVKITLLSIVALALLSACSNRQTMPHFPTSTPSAWGTRIALTERVSELTIQPLIATESARLASYELEPGETVVPLAVPGDMDFESIWIGFSGTHLEEESGQPQRWVAAMWLGSEQHPSAYPRPVHERDVVEFEGYRIRILGIDSGGVDFAIGESDRPPSLATATLSIYNTEPGEILRAPAWGREQQYGSMWYVFQDLRPQQFDDESSTDTGEAVVSVRVWSEQGSVDERQMRIGDVIVFEDYRLRLLKIGSSGVDIALTTLGDLPTPSEE
jgi:hypothetical protein